MLLKKSALLAVVIVMVGSLAACGGGGSSVAVEETTTTTIIPPLTQLQIDSALPTALELPIGWSATGTGGKNTLDPAEGPGKGSCGGPDAAARAVAQKAVGYVSSGRLKTGNEAASADVGVYAFPTVENARAFFGASSFTAVVCPEGIEYDGSEPEPVYVDGPSATWHYMERSSLGSAKVALTDESFSKTTETTQTVKYSGREFSYSYLQVEVYSRVADVVVVVSINGLAKVSGFSDSASVATNRPAVTEVMAAADAMLPVILKKIGQRPGQPESTTTTAVEIVN